MSKGPEPPGPQYPMGAPYHTGVNYTEVARECGERNYAILPQLQQFVIDVVMKDPPRGVCSLDCSAITGQGTNYYSPRITELRNGGLFYRNGTKRYVYINGKKRGPAEVHWLIPGAVYNPEAARKPSKPRTRTADDRREQHEHNHLSCQQCMDIWDKGRRGEMV